MARRKDKIRLGAFLYPTGHHVAAWRHPDAQADAGANFAHYVHLAQTAERGCFDAVFMLARGATICPLSAVSPPVMWRSSNH
jgi:N-acetyl-S-(2-succino)cysteine monooxygenase